MKYPNFTKALVFADQAMVSGSNFILGILLVRWLGLEIYGVYALLWMGVLFALGVNHAFVTKPLLSIAPKMEKEEQRKYFSGLHVIQIFVSVLLLLIGLGLYFVSNFFFENEVAMLIPITSGIVFCQALHDYYRKINFVKGQVVFANFLDSIFYVGQLVVVGLLIYFEKLELREILVGIFAVNLLSVAIGFLQNGLNVSQTDNIKKIFKRHFHFSKWLLSTSVVQWLSGNYFIIVGASIIGTTAVGAVRMVQNIMGLCHILFLAMENFVPIEAARRFHLDGEKVMKKYLISNTRKLGFGFLLALIGLVIFSPQILKLLYGSESMQYSYIVFGYAILYVFVFLGHPFRFYLRTIEKTFPIFVAYIFGAAFSLIAARFMIKNFEMNGLLAGLIITQVITLITYFFFIKKQNLPTAHEQNLPKEQIEKPAKKEEVESSSTL